MTFAGALTHLASWLGNVMLPTLAGLFFSAAIYRYSRDEQSRHMFYGAFASLMCSGIVRAMEGFVQNAGPTSADAYWKAVLNLVNWTANVIMPVYALLLIAEMVLHMGGVVSEIYPGSTWIRKFLAAMGALLISGFVRFAEAMVMQAHGI